MPGTTMDRVSFDMRGNANEAIDAAQLARRIVEAHGLQLARGTAWMVGHEPMPDNARRMGRQFDLLVLGAIGPEVFDAVADVWRLVGLVAGTSAGTPWQVCRASHGGGLPAWSRDVEAMHERDARKCNGWRNWDTWNVVGAVDNVQGNLQLVTDAAQTMPVQEFAAELLDAIEDGRLQDVGAVDTAVIDVRAIYDNYRDVEA